MANFNRVVLVAAKTRLEELKERNAGSLAAAEFAIRQSGQDLKSYQAEQAGWDSIRSTVGRKLPRGLPLIEIQRDELPRFLFDSRDLVIAVGPDGLFVNVAKYVHGQPILTLNPSPATIDGVLMRFAGEQVSAALNAMFNDAYQVEEVTLAEACIADQQPILGVNEIVIGRCDPQAANYTLKYKGREERQRATRLLITTGCGSTGWARSIVAGAQALVADGYPQVNLPFARTDKHLIYLACEPFVSQSTGASLAFGKLADGETLEVVSDMALGGAIYSDGMWRDARDFPTGAKVTIQRSKKTARRVTNIKA